MNIYEIDRAIRELIESSIDPETGELVVDPEQFDALQMERETKIENTVLLLKNVRAEITAIKTEEAAMEDRRKAKERFAKRLEGLVRYATAGERFETARASVQFRKTPEKAEIDEGCEAQLIEWARRENSGLLWFKDPELNKTAIKAALKAGDNIPFARLTSGTSMVIK